MELDEKILYIRGQILKGLELTFKRLVIRAAKNDEWLVFSENGKPVKIKATEILKKMNLPE